jgi:hypothetical protein
MLDHFNAATKHNRIILEANCQAADDCAICLDRLTNNTCAYLPCTHLFHNRCLHQAFEQKLYSCPLCRYDLVEALKKTNFIFPVADHFSADASFINDVSFIDGIYRIYLTASPSYNNVPFDYDNPFTYAYVNSNGHITSTHDDNNELMPDLVDSDMEMEMEEINTTTHQQDRWTGLLTNIMRDTLFGPPSQSISSTTLLSEPLPPLMEAEANEPEMSFYDFLVFFNT